VKKKRVYGRGPLTGGGRGARRRNKQDKAEGEKGGKPITFRPSVVGTIRRKTHNRKKKTYKEARLGASRNPTQKKGGARRSPFRRGSFIALKRAFRKLWGIVGKKKKRGG